MTGKQVGVEQLKESVPTVFIQQDCLMWPNCHSTHWWHDTVWHNVPWHIQEIWS